MSITKKIMLFVLVFFLTFSSFCLATSEPVTTNNEENSDNSEAINIINTDLYISSQDVVIEDSINGNVFAMGSSVTVKGEILGDLFVLTNTLTIEESAVIHNNIFALASTSTIKGEVYDLYISSNNFELTDTGYIYRDLKVSGDNVTLNGPIAKDAYITANSITMPENARNLIGGNLHYTSSEELTFPENAVLGEIKYTSSASAAPTTEQIISSYITNFITTIIYALVIILLIVFFGPKFTEKLNYALIKKSYISAGIGIASIILIPVLAIVLLITGFLAYISLATLVVYGLILSISLALFGIAIGKHFAGKLKNPSKGKLILFSILATIVLWFAQIIPYIGGYISIFIYVVGLGMFIFAFFIRKDVSELGKKKKKDKANNKKQK